MLPVKVPPSRLCAAESSTPSSALRGGGGVPGPISRPRVCWSKVGTPTWRQPPKHSQPPRGKRGHDPVPPRGSALCGGLLVGTVRHLSTHCVWPRTAVERGASPIHLSTGPPPLAPRLRAAGAEGGMRRGVTPLNPRICDRDPAEYRLPGWRITSGGSRRTKRQVGEQMGGSSVCYPCPLSAPFGGAELGRGSVRERERERV